MFYHFTSHIYFHKYALSLEAWFMKFKENQDLNDTTSTHDNLSPQPFQGWNGGIVNSLKHCNFFEVF